jgi:predicted anti-sigma-YlaC factor YlaD
MNCRDIEPLLLAERDGVLTKDQHAKLERHVAACPSCQQWRARLNDALDAYQAESAAVNVPDADAEWHLLRAQLNGDGAKPARKRPLAPVIWFGSSLAVAAALALVFLVAQPKPAEPAPVSVAQSDGTADAATMAYVDKDSGWLVVWAADSETKTSG